jgi:integrase
MDIGPDGGFIAAGVKREPWTTADTIRRIFREAYERAALPYFRPHAIRDTIVQLGLQTCTTAEAFKAWSQNLGHEKATTTWVSYGPVSGHRQVALIREMAIARASAAESVEVRLARLARLEAAMAGV